MRNLAFVACIIGLAGVASASPNDFLHDHRYDDCVTYQLSTARPKVKLKSYEIPIWFVYNMGPSDVAVGSSTSREIFKPLPADKDNTVYIGDGRPTTLSLFNNGSEARAYVCIPK